MTRRCASVITTPWLRLFSAELTKALRRSCERLTRRSAGMHPQRDRRQEGHDDDAADQDFPDHVGIELADIARRRKAVGDAAQARPHGATAATRHTRACAGIEFLPPACQFLSAISHPRISAAECLASRVWIG